MLSRVLPYDDDDDREIARQTIYDPVDFSFPPWDKVSKEGKDIVSSNSLPNISVELLEKPRSRRPNI